MLLIWWHNFNDNYTVVQKKTMDKLLLAQKEQNYYAT